MLVITRIPTHRNDGSKIGTRERRAILTLVRDTFGGYTLEGPFQDAWMADDGQTYEETSYRLEVVLATERLSEARALFSRIGKQLGQRAIYFEVREGGEIIDLEQVEIPMSKRSTQSRAKQLLALARQLTETPGLTWVEANNAIYGPGGAFARLFPSVKERVAFGKMEESRTIDQLIDALPETPPSPQRREYSGKFNVRVPKSLHAALAREADAEGVSLNQLVVAKLALNLQVR